MKKNKSDIFLRKLVLSELKKFGKPKDPSSCKAKEVDADALASTLEKKEDFTVKENAKIADKVLAIAEQKLVKKLKEVRLHRAKIAKTLNNK